MKCLFYILTALHLSSLNSLDVLMNREVTEMSMFRINEDASEHYLQHDDLNSRLMYNIFSAFAERQAGNYSMAYDYIMAAQKIDDRGGNDYTSGMIWLGKFLMSQYVNNYQAAVEQAFKASSKFEGTNIDYNIYMLDAIRSCMILGRYEAAEAMLAEMEQRKQEMSHMTLSKYYDTLLNLYRNTDTAKIRNVIRLMRAELREVDIYWLNVSYSLSLIGEQEAAVSALEKHKQFIDRFGESAAYYGVSAYVLENTGHHKEAMEYYRKYIDSLQETYQEILDSGLLLKEEQMKAEIIRLKSRHGMMVLSMGMIILVLLVSFVMYNYRNRLAIKQKEVEFYAEMLQKAEDEKARLNLMYENKSLDRTLRDALLQRLKVFDKFTLSKMSPNYSEKLAEEELRRLIDSKDTFLESTCRAFEAVHPKFAAFLVGCDLTERERGCCFLYCMGMRGNEIAAYMGLTDQSYYNFSSTIRKKLGLKEYKTNLDRFLRDKMNESDL